MATDTKNAAELAPAGSVPRSRDDDYSAAAAAERRRFVGEHTGVRLQHVASASFDPAIVRVGQEYFGIFAGKFR